MKALIYVAVLALTAFWLLGIHHYLKHRELQGFQRFMQYRDVWKAWWYLVKSHEGWQTICLIMAAADILNEFILKYL